MIAVVQRARDVFVEVDKKVVGKIESGLVILLGVFQEDTEVDAEFLAGKISGFRIFSDLQGKMNLSIQETGGGVLVISQFTLCGDWRKGRRPSFIRAAAPSEGKRLYEYFIDCLKKENLTVESGVFGAMMDVHLVNEGPVTFVLDSKER
ncbi:MAG: D-tyrosyl-tRNA(Tyr) deacylase [Candidatus Marinimicrobia bacterium CG08_land_8_20_14_0_20_45_22]|nr:MAG: D-tyrosyl-tRNA(Tyr) deacylase [Candidatus Marinimicrobia bacterium CG08_land_8_20_14_0_20_45_22]